MHLLLVRDARGSSNLADLLSLCAFTILRWGSVTRACALLSPAVVDVNTDFKALNYSAKYMLL